MTPTSTRLTLFRNRARSSLLKRGWPLNNRFLCPNCLHFGDFDFACGECWAEIPRYTIGNQTQTCPHCRQSVLSADAGGLRAYCKQCQGNCDPAIYHQRRVRVLATLRSADSELLCRAIRGQESRSLGGKGYVYDDGAQLAFVLNLSTFRGEALRPSRTHALWEMESIWLDQTASEPKGLALEWGEAADRFINQTKLTEAQRREINVCVRQAEANSVVKAVLDARFGGVRSGVAEAEFLFQRAQTKAVAVREIASPPIGALISALKENDPNERKEATEGLGNIGYDRAVPALIAALLNETTRDEAAEVLVRIGKPAVPALIAVLKGRDVGSRFCAAAALVRIGQPALAMLITALGESGSVASVVINLGEAETLIDIGRTAVPALIAALKDGDPMVRWQAAKALGEIGDSSATPALIAVLNDPQWKVREQTAKALGKIGDKSAVPAMIAALNNDRSSMKERLAAFLGKVIHLDVRNNRIAIIRILTHATEAFKHGRNLNLHRFYGEDSEFHKRFGAFRGLDGPSPSVSISYVREAAAIGLGEIGDASAVPALIAALGDDDPDVIKAATRALVKVGTPALPGLIAALKHRRLRVCRLAAAALGEIGDQSGVPPLEDADRKYHESYHCEFCDALRRLDAK
jgi:HEAT repeat protein